ncbi:hypothetical protein [Paraburkholderia sediminicola]|uniref:hypothetical protein n=1 Tax=Paraburkholderia sediminicola TaxID=458836 RepID=UPI0038B90047
MMTNPASSIMAMPTMGTSALPTSTSSYQTLLNNMLASENSNPMNGLGGGSNFMPGAGGTMNPGMIIPGMY